MLVFDDEQRGRAVRVTAGGGKSFLAQYSFVGSKRRIPLGSCSAISLADARLAARQISARSLGAKIRLTNASQRRSMLSARL
jgi:hypothetical protein